MFLSVSIRSLTAVAQTLVGDVANVIRIDTFRSTPIIVNGSTNPKPATERSLSLRPALVESFPVKLLPETVHVLAP